MTTPKPVTFADLARLYEQATSAPPGGAYTNIFRDGLIEAVGFYVQQDDPTVEIAYLKATLADLRDEHDEEDDRQVQTIERVRALIHGAEHVVGCEGEDTCPACWESDIRRAIAGGAS